MKKWNTPEVAILNLVETANVDKPGQSYDNSWAQDENGQWYLLAES